MKHFGNLNDLMQIDHVIRVKGGAIFDDVKGVWAPELRIGTDVDGISILDMHERHASEDLTRCGWDVQSGWSRQNSGRYNGIIMHPSEYVGGALADHIRETDGYWTVILAQTWPTDEDDDPEPAGWLLLHREFNTAQYVMTAGGWPDKGAITHRIRGERKYDGPNVTGCGFPLNSIHHRDSGEFIDITCKRQGCME